MSVVLTVWIITDDDRIVSLSTVFKQLCNSFILILCKLQEKETPTMRLITNAAGEVDAKSRGPLLWVTYGTTYVYTFSLVTHTLDPV